MQFISPDQHSNQVQGSVLRFSLYIKPLLSAPENYQLYVPESAQVGKAVGKIKANDEDLGINAEMEYKITNEEGAAMFSISADGDKREGVISLKKVWKWVPPFKRGNIISIWMRMFTQTQTTV